MEEQDLHYLGSMIDSEGCITVHVQPHPNSNFGYRLYPKVQLTGGKGEGKHGERHKLFTALAEEEGLSYNRSVYEKNIDNQYNKYSSTIEVTAAYSEDAYGFLQSIIPYLREKKEDASWMLSVNWPFLNGRTNWIRSEYLHAVEVWKKSRDSTGGSGGSKITKQDLLEQANRIEQKSAVEW